MFIASCSTHFLHNFSSCHYDKRIIDGNQSAKKICTIFQCLYYLRSTHFLITLALSRILFPFYYKFSTFPAFSSNHSSQILPKIRVFSAFSPCGSLFARFPDLANKQLPKIFWQAPKLSQIHQQFEIWDLCME